MTIDGHLIDPPDLYVEESDVDCPECDTAVPCEVDTCPACGYEITEDYRRDMAEAESENPAWA